MPPGPSVTFTNLSDIVRTSKNQECSGQDDEPAIVKDPLLSPPLGGLLLFLLFDFGGLRLDFASAGKRSVN